MKNGNSNNKYRKKTYQNSKNSRPAYNRGTIRTRIPDSEVKKDPSEPGDIRSSMPDPAEIRNILGIISVFRISKLTPIGAFLTPLGDTDAADTPAIENNISEPNISNPVKENFEILLPKNEFTDRELRRNELIKAFTYLDSEDRPVATLKTPALCLGEMALLKCNQVTNVGAFLEWGLIKDLFLPFKEQTVRINAGDEALVTLYLDKSSRLCASMKIYKLLKTDSPYKSNDHVTGFVYELSDRYGAYVAVDNIYSALIPSRELVKNLRVGERIELRVSKVLPDGKLELSMREQGYLQLNPDCETIYQELKNSTKGFLPYHDRTESLILKTKFNMSKNAFKRAIGHLYKQGMIDIKDDGIYLK